MVASDLKSQSRCRSAAGTVLTAVSRKMMLIQNRIIGMCGMRKNAPIR